MIPNFACALSQPYVPIENSELHKSSKANIEEPPTYHYYYSKTQNLQA